MAKAWPAATTSVGYWSEISLLVGPKAACCENHDTTGMASDNSSTSRRMEISKDDE